MNEEIHKISSFQSMFLFQCIFAFLVKKEDILSAVILGGGNIQNEIFNNNYKQGSDFSDTFKLKWTP